MTLPATIDSTSSAGTPPAAIETVRLPVLKSVLSLSATLAAKLRDAAVVEQERRAVLDEGGDVAVEIGDGRRLVGIEAEIERVVGVVAGAGGRLGRCSRA